MAFWGISNDVWAFTGAFGVLGNDIWFNCLLLKLFVLHINEEIRISTEI